MQPVTTAEVLVGRLCTDIINPSGIHASKLPIVCSVSVEKLRSRDATYLEPAGAPQSDGTDRQQGAEPPGLEASC